MSDALTSKKRRKQLYFTPADIANGIMAEQVFQSSQWVSARDYDALSARNAELVKALLAADARLDQPVFRRDEKAGNQAANILRADIKSALTVIRAALKGDAT